MQCLSAKKKISLWLDEELKREDKLQVEEHLKTCLLCQKEGDFLRTFQGLVRTAFPPVEISPGFEGAFWSKVIEREKEPWFVRVFKDLAFLIPTPSRREAFAVLFVAFLIGSSGGFFSAARTIASMPEHIQAQKISVQYLTGFGEFKGLPSTSVAGTYLRAVEVRTGS